MPASPAHPGEVAFFQKAAWCTGDTGWPQALRKRGRFPSNSTVKENRVGGFVFSVAGGCKPVLRRHKAAAQRQALLVGDVLLRLAEEMGAGSGKGPNRTFTRCVSQLRGDAHKYFGDS